MAKKLIYRNIFGKAVKVLDKEGEPEIIKLVTLPATGEEGKLYYNTTNDTYYTYDVVKGFVPFGSGVLGFENLPNSGEIGTLYYQGNNDTYYVWNGTAFVELVPTSMPVVYDADVRSDNALITAQGISTIYNIEPNKYYIFGQIGGTLPEAIEGGPHNSSDLGLYFVDATDGTAKTYAGRFTAGADSPTIVVLGGVHFPDDIIDIESGHTYEFNVLYDTILLTDITYTIPINEQVGQ